jgi:hypothetical protein
MGNVISRIVSPVSDTKDNTQDNIICNEFTEEERNINDNHNSVKERTYSNIGDYHTYENI